MTALHELTHARDLDALRTWLATTGTLDIADELSRLDPPEPRTRSRSCGAPVRRVPPCTYCRSRTGSAASSVSRA